jgi:hypothetical protein
MNLYQDDLTLCYATCFEYKSKNTKFDIWCKTAKEMNFEVFEIHLYISFIIFFQWFYKTN